MRILHQDFLHHDSQANACRLSHRPDKRAHASATRSSSAQCIENGCQQCAVGPFANPHTHAGAKLDLYHPTAMSDLSLAPFDDGDDVTVKAGGSAGVSHGGASSTRANPSPFC